ncbi:MAG TPA: ferrous iron transporter B, partial [Gammaproteobacteria bacterium]
MKRIALLGMPNTGKSTFFNRLTGAVARVGNWPGITVELLDARILLGAEMVEVVDLPGIYNLHGYSEDEQVVRHFLEHNPVNLLCVVANAAQLDRQLSLVLQLKELGLPMVLLLNMMDEAKRLGVEVEQEKLEKALGVPVIPLSAKHGQGFPWAKGMLEKSLQGTTAQSADPAKFAHDDELEQALEKLVNETVHTPIQLTPTLTCRIDRTLLHPWLGLPLFLLSMYLLFEAVYTVGTPLQDGVEWLLGLAKQLLIEPALAGTSPALQSFLLEGVYNGVGTVLTFLPIIVLFFLFMGVVEDSGYLSRAAFLMDAFMGRLGLDGRSFVMQLMGFGCNVPALMGTRVMRSRNLRLLTMLVIPLSLCSARLQVFVFLTAILFSPSQAPFVLFFLYLASFAAIFLTALIYKGKYVSHEPFILEVPPDRVPTPRPVWLRGWQEVRHFLNRASKFIVIGVVLVWALTNFPTDVAPASSGTLA